MIIDLALAVILLICIIRGRIRGFAPSCINLCGWIVSFLAAFIFKSFFIDLINKFTSFGTDLQSKIEEKIAQQIMQESAAGTAEGSLPTAVESALTQAADKSSLSQAAEVAGPVVDALMNVFAFLILFAIIKFIFFFIERAFSRLADDYSLGDHDFLFGILANTVKGLMCCYALILLTIYMASMLDIQSFSEQVQNCFTIDFLKTMSLLNFPDRLWEMLI